jgi:hypothetical protein
VPAKHE